MRPFSTKLGLLAAIWSLLLPAIAFILPVRIGSAKIAVNRWRYVFVKFDNVSCEFSVNYYYYTTSFTIFPQLNEKVPF